jgi:VWFA-related protein
MTRTRLILCVAVLALLTLAASRNRPSIDNPGRTVTFDVAVTDKNDNPVGGLHRQDFKVFEENVEQQITRFSVNTKPVALVVLVEYNDTLDHFSADVIDPAVGLVRALSPEDWGAVVAFDVMPDIVTDFTHDKTALVSGLRSLQMPQYREAALYDALYFTLDRMKGLEEKKAIVLLGTGLDNMSNKRTFGDVLRRAQSSDTTIYTIGLTKSPRILMMPDNDPGRQIRMNDAENTLSALAEASGGLSFIPQFPGQYRRLYETVNADLHNQYTLTFVSTSTKETGRLRKLKVQVGATDIDFDGKPDRLKVRHKAGHYGGSY